MQPYSQLSLWHHGSSCWRPACLIHYKLLYLLKEMGDKLKEALMNVDAFVDLIPLLASNDMYFIVIIIRWHSFRASPNSCRGHAHQRSLTWLSLYHTRNNDYIYSSIFLSPTILHWALCYRDYSNFLDIDQSTILDHDYNPWLQCEGRSFYYQDSYQMLSRWFENRSHVPRDWC